MTNPVLEAIRTRRMVRSLTGEAIARSELEEILKAARWRRALGTVGSIASSQSRIP